MINFINTERDEALEAVKTINQFANNGLEFLEQATISAFNCFWYNSAGVSPEIIAEKFGKNAVSAFNYHADAVVFLLTHGSKIEPSQYTPPYNFEKNEDGTVTIKNKLQ